MVAIDLGSKFGPQICDDALMLSLGNLGTSSKTFG
jgi:hypothetical protein